ncbi:MAG: carbohydrate kinase [Acidobacteriia bacterium]|nr:carbohydrate kinase [Terriglobia bacterium]
MKIISLGEILWDIFPQAEHLGGAPFNFALHAHNLGHEIYFVSAVGKDRRGQLALDQMEAADISTRFVRRVSDYPTGTVTVSFSNSGGPQYRIHRPVAYDFPNVDHAEFGDLVSPSPQWIYYGTLQQMSASAHELTMRLLGAAPSAKRFYDVNLRIDSYTPDLVRGLTRQADILKLSEEEHPAVQEIIGITGHSREQFCRNCAHEFDLEAVCITRGLAGCSLLLKDEFLEAPGFRVRVADTIGAGDAFSSALVHGLGAGWTALQIADFANRVGALVASRAGGAPRWSVQEAMGLGDVNTYRG